MPTNKGSESKPTPLFPKDYWERPVLTPGERGDGASQPIFTAVGFALSSWEGAEIAFGNLFLVMSECETPNSYNAVRRAFGSIESSGGRRRALEAVAEIYFGQSWENRFIKRSLSDLLEAFECGSRRRDEIAHGFVYSVSVNNNSMGTFLFPPEYNTQRTLAFMKNDPEDPLSFTRSKYRYKASTISEFGIKFAELGKATTKYLLKIKKIQGVPALHWAVTLRDLSEEIRRNFFSQHGVDVNDMAL